MSLSVSVRRTRAVFNKQMKDILKNRVVFLQFLLFPIMAFLLTYLIGEQEDIPKGLFALMSAPMYAGMVPLVTMAVVIGEEKEKKSLKMLVMSGVKPTEYLVGTCAFVVLAMLIGSLIFALIAELTFVMTLLFLGTMLLGSVASLLLGCLAGILSKNQMNASAIATPMMMLVAFVPMFAQFNEGVRKVAFVLYTQQISNIFEGMTDNSIDWVSFLVIAANAIVFAAVFALCYRRRNLDE